MTRRCLAQSVHQFTCRGAFHLRDRSRAADGDDDVGNNDRFDDDGVARIRDGDDLERLLDDTFLCNGIATRLRHVADYPLARDRDEAVAWFEGSSSPASTSMAPPGGGAGKRSQQQHWAGMPEEDGERNSFGRRRNTQRLGGRRDDSEKVQRDDDIVEVDDGGTFSSYGTTQVNVLTLKEVRPPPSAMVDAMADGDDPFGQFGPLLGAAGMMNPFGSLFGGFFGHGSVDPWGGIEDGEGEGDGRGEGGRGPPANPWAAAMGGGSRSVSSSTRTARDANGKRVTTTVTKTTTVDSDGNRRTETETTVRHLDDGGRVERSRVVEEDGNAAQKKRPEEPRRTQSVGLAAAKRLAAQPVEGIGGARRGDDETAAAADDVPAEVTMIATDCIFGLSISDVPSTDPDMPQGAPGRQGKQNKSQSEPEAGWRQTEYTFRLGRFFPPSWSWGSTTTTRPRTRGGGWRGRGSTTR